MEGVGTLGGLDRAYESHLQFATCLTRFAYLSIERNTWDACIIYAWGTCSIAFQCIVYWVIYCCGLALSGLARPVLGSIAILGLFSCFLGQDDSILLFLAVDGVISGSVGQREILCIAFIGLSSQSSNILYYFFYSSHIFYTYFQWIAATTAYFFVYFFVLLPFSTLGCSLNTFLMLFDLILPQSELFSLPSCPPLLFIILYFTNTSIHLPFLPSLSISSTNSLLAILAALTCPFLAFSLISPICVLTGCNFMMLLTLHPDTTADSNSFTLRYMGRKALYFFLWKYPLILAWITTAQ